MKRLMSFCETVMIVFAVLRAASGDFDVATYAMALAIYLHLRQQRETP